MVPVFEDFLYPFLLAIKDGSKTIAELKQWL